MSIKYTTLDVFTNSRFYGNPLAIVHLPSSISVSQEQKQLIAREFNFSETVILHDLDQSNGKVRVDIFTPTEELPFAGHPTVGSGWYLLTQNPALTTVTLLTKAGEIPVIRDGAGARLDAPIDFKIHEPYLIQTLKSSQLLDESSYVNGKDGVEPIVSIVKGMTFVLLQLSSVEALGQLRLWNERLGLPDDYLGEYQGFVGLYAFVETANGIIRARMLEGTLEDPATGSAASTLGGYLGKKKGHGVWRFSIVQGVEMGRKSEISVVTTVGADGEVKKVELAGEAVKVMEGSLYL